VFVVAVFTFATTSISARVIWNETFSYLSKAPYKARLITTYIKLFLDASPSLLAGLSFYIKIKLFTADFEKVDYIIENFDGYIVFACAIFIH